MAQSARCEGPDVLMQMMLWMAAGTMGLFLLRSAWRVLVEVPDADQLWTPDLVDDFLSRSIAALLLANSASFLLLTARALG
jgi:hypothetical protein